MAIKVLLADDSITIQKVISIIFSGAEYSLTVVSNGTAAVEKARELIPDVMLKEGEGLFLDDMTLDELGKQLGCRVVPFEADSRGFYRALRELKRG